MAFDPKAWLGQATTGAGFAAILGTLGAVASGQMTWQQAAPLLAAAAIGLMWPENTAAKQGASNLVADLIAFTPLISAAIEHGKANAAAAAPANGGGQVAHTVAVTGVTNPPMAAPASVPAPAAAPVAVPAGGAIATVLGLFLLFGVAACGSVVPATALTPAAPVPAMPKSPGEAVVELQTAYIGALEIATSYAQLPRCGPGAPALCASPSVLAVLVRDKPQASRALDAARAALAAYDAAAAPGTLATINAAIDAAGVAVASFAADAKSAKGV